MVLVTVNITIKGIHSTIKFALCLVMKIFFISYSTKIDKVSQFAKELKTKLKHEPGVVEVFICEEDIPFGEVWDQYIARKLKDCHAFIPIIMQKYLDSAPCHKEIKDATYTYKKPFFLSSLEIANQNMKRANMVWLYSQ